MRVWVGTAGYSFPEWQGGFYPPGTPLGRLLSYYARQFPFVELSSTFHHCPTPASLERLAAQVPNSFRIAVKVPKSISHDQSDHDIDAFEESIYALGDRVSMLVAQFPPTFHHSIRHRQWLNRLAGMIESAPLGIEFRHWSWKRPDTVAYLSELGLHAISVDVPTIPTLFPRGLIRSGQRIYVRLHSRDADGWYRDDAERHDYVYTAGQLGEWADALEAESSQVAEAYVVFNNGRDVQAVNNARRMTEVLRGRPGLDVQQPACPSLPRQLSLFDA